MEREKMNKEVKLNIKDIAIEEAMKRLRECVRNSDDEYATVIIQQAFSDMELQLANANAQMTIQSKNLINVVNENVKLINYNLELKRLCKPKKL
jgi:sugar-specific transcriptional regulator TrmB